MYDTYGNSSELNVHIRGTDSINSAITIPAESSHQIIGNILAVYSPKDSVEYGAQFHFSGVRKYEMPSYSVDGQNVYLWNLLDGIPDSVTMRDKNERIPTNVMIPLATPMGVHLEIRISPQETTLCRLGLR